MGNKIKFFFSRNENTGTKVNVFDIYVQKNKRIPSPHFFFFLHSNSNWINFIFSFSLIGLDFVVLIKQ